jgi:hypothetical protein
MKALPDYDCAFIREIAAAELSMRQQELLQAF